MKRKMDDYLTFQEAADFLGITISGFRKYSIPFFVGYKNNRRRFLVSCQHIIGLRYNCRLQKVIASFDKFTEKSSDGCWEWIGAKMTQGYGVISYNGNGNISAHRFSAFFYWGFDLNSDKQVLHHCDNRGCVNPNHFFFGNHKQNILDASLKGRKRGFGFGITYKEKLLLLDLVNKYSITKISKITNRPTSTLYSFYSRYKIRIKKEIIMRIAQTVTIDTSGNALKNTQALVKQRKFSEFVTWCVEQTELINKFKENKNG